MTRMNNIIFIEATLNYPYSFSASNTKVHFLCEGLKRNGDICTIINSSNQGRRKQGIHKGVPFYIISKNLFSFCIDVSSTIKRLYNKNSNNYVVVTAPNILKFILIWFISRLHKYRLLGLYHEYYQTCFGRSRWDRKILSKWFDYTFGYFCDAILPISEFLRQKCQHFNKPMLKVPIVADFDSYRHLPQRIDCNEYFLYCGNVGYARVLYILIDSFLKLLLKGYKVKLRLVLHGSPALVKKFKKYVLGEGIAENVEFYANLEYNDLLNHYKNAIALLIPLDKKSVQDQARFSQKIAEYLSAKRPIITVNTGEIPYYFTDGENSLILEELKPELMLEKMEWVIAHPLLANKVGLNGFDLGLKNFDYLINGCSIHSFLSSLNP